jgi:hypothetical protein
MTVERIPPFYRDFRTDRLTILPTPPLSTTISITNGTQAGGAGYFSYLDPWLQDPYAYFSAYKKLNGYNRYLAYYAALGLGQQSDCPSLTVPNPYATTVLGVWPYAQTAGTSANPLATYLNKDTYQIICAGPDKKFGQGTPMTIVSGVQSPTPASSLWSPSTTGSMLPDSRDDFSNFYDKQLGSGE